jgi:hypothetical protein
VEDRLGMVATCTQLCHQALRGLDEAPAEVLPLGEEPLVLTAFQQISPVQPDGLPQRGHAAVGVDVGAAEGVLEGGHVQPERPLRAPVQRPRGHLEEPVDLGKGPAEVVQDMAKIRARLRLGRVGPQQERQAPAGLRRIPVEQQVGEQRLRPRRLQRRQRRRVQAQVPLPQEPDAQERPWPHLL